MKIFKRIGLLSFLLIVLISSAPAIAQTTAGVGISPAVIEERVDPGEVKSFAITLNNLTSEDKIYYLASRDISGVEPGGVPIFVRESAELTGLEFSQWITLERTEVFIPADGQAIVGFVVNVPDNAAPGGHFGGVIVSVEPPRLDRTGASIGYEVANIISLRVSGEVIEGAQLRQFTTSQYIYSTPNVEFEARIINQGNTLIRPIGPLKISNMLGQQTTMINFNETGRAIFPFAEEVIKARWEGDGLGFGRYQVELTLAYGDDTSRFLDNTLTFWILPMNIIVPALVVLLVIILSIYIGVKIYIRRTMAIMAGGSARRLHRARGGRNEFPTFLVFMAMLAVCGLFLIVLLLLFA